MDRDDAAYAAGLIGARQVMPIHFDSFPPIETDVEAFRSDLSAKGVEALVLEPGETATL
jgi:L-ascorbate metabolism protein UlaG (beta-lactamase superfamily)